MDTFKYPLSDWLTAKREARAAMVAAIQRGRTITYGELTAKISTIHFEPDAHVFHELLGQISKTENDEGRGMLSVVVVYGTGEKRGQPGDGFFKLARELGRDVHNRDEFFSLEFRRVQQAWQNAR
jgi:hypothetical protein